MKTDAERQAAAISEQMHIDFCHALAGDFMRTTRYVALSADNFNTYSIEYVRLLLDACSEVEALATLYCDQLFQDKYTAKKLKKRNPTITDWGEIIRSAAFGFWGAKVSAPNLFVATPWDSWAGPRPTSPDWWDAYQKVKHDRSANFPRANMLNTFQAICGMMVLASRLSFHKYRGIGQPWFEVKN